MGLKAVFFDLDDTLYTSFQAGDAYAYEKLEKWADSMFLTGKGEEASRILERAARLRLRFACDEQEIPQELLNRKPVVIYTCNRSDMGVPDTDRKELEAFIDSIPEVPSVVRERVKEAERIKQVDVKKRMLEDREEFGGQDAQ